MPAASNRTADDVDDGAERLVADVSRDVGEPLRDQPIGEDSRGSRFQRSRFKVHGSKF
jgi:hypothetical protein